MRARDTIEPDPTTLALSALVWTLSDAPRAERLLSLTGLDSAELRARAGGARAARRGARLPRAARTRSHRLRRRAGRPPGGADRRPTKARIMTRPLLITDCDEVLLHMVAHFRDWLDEAHGIDFAIADENWGQALARKDTGEKVRARGGLALCRRLLRHRDGAPDAGEGHDRGARPDHRPCRHRRAHQPARSPPPAAHRPARAPRHRPRGLYQPGRQGRSLAGDPGGAQAAGRGVRRRSVLPAPFGRQGQSAGLAAAHGRRAAGRTALARRPTTRMRGSTIGRTPPTGFSRASQTASPRQP